MRYPKNWPEGVPKPPPIPQHYWEDEQWLMEHENELAQQYPDQWVAVFNKEVVATGNVLAEVLRGIESFIIRLVATVRLRTGEGWTQDFLALLDPATPHCILPYSVWSLAEHRS